MDDVLPVGLATTAMVAELQTFPTMQVDVALGPQGTLLLAALPVTDDPLAEGGEGEASRRRPTGRANQAPSPQEGINGHSAEPIKILLIDDVEGIRFLLKTHLEESGKFEVVGEAGTGREGIAVASRRQPDLVLLDLSMPDMDGLEALPRILEVAPESKVAIYSGFEAQRLEATARRLGAIGYLEKGIEPQELVQALSRMLAQAN